MGTMDLLSADELPRSLMMSYNNIPLEVLELKTEIVYLRTGEPFLRIVWSECDETTMSLLFMGALIKQHNHFYLFDFHSRDEWGLSVAGRTSILLKFSEIYSSVLSRMSKFGTVIFSVAVCICEHRQDIKVRYIVLLSKT